MTSIVANARTVRQLLGGRKYGIDYFQREYRWETKQIEELVTDLTGRFRASWRPEHTRPDVANYGTYFLGSVIVSSTAERRSVIDGQQRLTSLTLLLIWLLRRVEGEDQRTLADLIFSRAFGTNAYNLDVPERRGAMDALYNGEAFNRDGQPESVRNILDRFDDIEEAMPDEIAGDVAAMFADWLVEKVTLVEIETPSDDDGYEVFETMNDRGLSLTPADLLKSHLLARAGAIGGPLAQRQEAAEARRRQLNTVWKTRIDELNTRAADEAADAIKAWLRARHATTIRDRSAGAVPGDFDRIGTEFHRWVRDKGDELGLSEADDFARFVERDFAFYTRWYHELRRLTTSYVPGEEALFSNGHTNFTLQYPLMLASLEPGEPAEASKQKIAIVASYVDILLNRRLWNNMSIDYNTMQYAMFLAMLAVRGRSAVEIATDLRARLVADVPPFEANPRFRMWPTYKKPARRFLARISAWVDERFGHQSSFAAYLSSSGAQGYDIEHVMADHPDRYVADFPITIDFHENRDRIGDLLLLPKSFNRSYGDLAYELKREHYLTQNALAQTFHPSAYDHNPGLRRLVAEGLPFEPFEHFGKAELEKRQTLYTRLAEIVWSPDRLAVEAGS